MSIPTSLMKEGNTSIRRCTCQKKTTACWCSPEVRIKFSGSSKRACKEIAEIRSISPFYFFQKQRDLILQIVTVMERADLCGFPDPDPAEETAEEKPDKPFFVLFKQNDIVFINDPAAVDQFFVDRYDSRSLEIRGILKS